MTIELGKILKPQGIRGELKVLPLTQPDLLSPDTRIVVAGRTGRIVTSRIRDGYVYLTLDFCGDRNYAETLRDKFICMPSDTKLELEPGKYLYGDLVGCRVYAQDGEYLGEIIEVENYGASDIFTIHHDFENISCPFLRSVFVSVDVVAKKVVVDKARFVEVTQYED